MTTTMTLKTCSNCHAEKAKLVTGRCEPCYRYFKRHGTEKLVAGSDAVRTATALDTPGVVATLAEADMVQTGVTVDTPVVVAEAPAACTDARVQYVLDLVAQGPQALAAAIQAGRVRVRTAAYAQQQHGTPRRGADTLTARQANFLLGRQLDASFKIPYAERRELFRKGLLVSFQEADAALTPKAEQLLAAVRGQMTTETPLAS
jgi:hypothetical protein